MRSGAHLEPPAQERGHDSDDKPLGASEGEGDRRERKVAPSRTERVDHDDERVEEQPYLLRPGKLNQLKASRQKTLSAKGRRSALITTLTLLASEGFATLQRTPSKGNKARQVGVVDRVLGELDEDVRMARGGGSRKRLVSSQEGGGRARDNTEDKRQGGGGLGERP